MKSASAFVPGHISGFFQVCDEHDDPGRRGSRNCGPCIGAGVRTEVSVEPSSREQIEIFVDGRKASEAKTSLIAVKLALEDVSGPQRIVVRHRTQAPVGAGYGLSGAGALGAVLALSETMNLRLERSEVASIAHRAEVSCDTGLGDVGAQMLGGLVIGVEPGAPPHGKWGRIEVPEGLKIVCGTLGPLETKQLLKDPELKRRSKKAGGNALHSLMRDPTLQNFMRVSREFAQEIGVLDNELLHIIDEISLSSPFGASAVMLGRAAFAPVKNSKLDAVKRTFSEFFEPESILVANIDFDGAKLIT